jgi:hypothetical protein
MRDTVQKPAPEAPPAPSLSARLRARARTILLVVVPLIAIIAGLSFYLAGGRYNARWPTDATASPFPRVKSPAAR